MTKRDLFIFFIRLFGIISFCSIILQIPIIVFELSEYIINSLSEYVYTQLLHYGLLVGLYLVLIFKTTLIVNLFKLDEGFEEDYIYVEEITVESIMKVGIIIAGILMMANSIPQFIQHVIYSFKSSNMNISTSSFEKINWIGSLLQIVMGYIMVVHYKWLVRFFKLDQNESKELDTQLLDDVENV